MKNLLRILLLIVTVCCWSCSTGGEDVPSPTPKPTPQEKPKVEVTTETPVFVEEGGTTTVTFTSTEAWTLDVTEGRAVSWCTVTPTSGSKGTNTLTVTTTANDTYDERNAKVTIKAGSTLQSFTITQKQKDGLTVTSNKVELTADGGEFSIEVKANVNVSYEIEETAQEWISIAEGRGLSSKTLCFEAKANNSIDRREGKIFLKGGDGLGEVVTVYQEGEKSSLVLTTEKAMTIGSEGGVLKVELKSNSEIQLEGIKEDWLRLSESRGMSDYTYYFEVDPNDTYDERNAAITFTSGTQKQIVTITQKQLDALIVNSNKVELAADGSEFSIEVKANVNVSYEIEKAAQEWISIIEGRGLNPKIIYFTAKANNSTERREGRIILKGSDGLSETVTVYQEGEESKLVITSDDIIVGSDGETIKIEVKSNVDYTMTLPSVDWIYKEDSRAISAYTHYLAIAPNETYDQRNAVVYFLSEVEELKDSISITQLQKDAIILAKNEYEVAQEGGKLEFTINANVDFEVSTSVDWIKPETGSRGLAEKALSFMIEANESKESREGEIVIAYEDLKQTIKVIQGAIDYEVIEIERAALIEFYKAAGGPDWVNQTNWCSDKPLGEWYGIQTDERGRVERISFIGNGEKGDIAQIIPPLANLKELKSLTLCPNNEDIYGTLPKEIYEIEKLESLEIDSPLEGELTSDILRLKELKSISLNVVKVSESVLKEICCSLTELEHLSFNYCRLNGRIPEEIGNLKKLRYLGLGSAGLEGDIPESLWELPLLYSIVLWSNPNLTGSISPNINNLKDLLALNFDGCSLSGSIPVEICECTNLGNIWLNDNNLEGNIPVDIGNLKKLRILALENNNLTGNLPVSMSEMTELSDCLLYGNRLSGEVPEEVSDMWQKWNPVSMIVPQQEGYKLTYKSLYSSTDYSKDGEVLLLQKHTEGNGIPVIFLGDAFVDKDMEAGGFYEKTMQRAMEAYFSIEPMISLRPLFDVYVVKCVSENDYIGANTALSFRHLSGSDGEADLDKCLEYASLVLKDFKDAQIKVIVNDQQQTGICYFMDDNCTISFNSLFNTGLDWQNFEATIRHEAIGHGFGLLADEYVTHSETIPVEVKEALKYNQQLGHSFNIDFTNNPTQVLWSKFLSDERYADEDLGIYEGGNHYSYGVYRPSYNSIMRFNEPIFNAPSREAIYKRAMRLAYGEDWTYDYEEFVKFDEAARRAVSRSVFKPLTEAEQKEYMKNHRPPKFVKGTWRDAIRNGKSKITVPLR